MSGEQDRHTLVNVVIPKVKERVLELYNIQLPFLVKNCTYITALPPIDFMLLLVGRDRLRPVTITEFTVYADMLCDQYITHKDALTRCRQIVAD
jgi:hypothetical protein